jgi:MoaA/NifB/PqqE/SkfB family radical SAM enzyme
MSQLKLYDGLEASPELERPYTDPENPKKEYYLPERLDLMVTGKCILRCAGCWGPSHNSVEPEMSPEQWRKIIAYVDMNNNSERYSSSLMASNQTRVCITGGEPLMYSELPQLVEGLHKDRTPTTLSTTGFDPNGVLPEVLPHIQELGIPIDGSTPEVNSLWRRGKLLDGGLGASAEAITLAQSEFPEVQVTVRTLVHADNYYDIPNIPTLLIDRGIDLSRINWKFYLHNSTTGPRRTGDELRPDPDQLNWLADQIAEHEGDFGSLTTLVPAMPQDRLVVNHTGDAYIVLPDGLVRTRDVAVGNLLTSPGEVISYINAQYPNFILRACRRAADLKFLKLVDGHGEAESPIAAAEQEFLKLVNELEPQVD